MHVIAGAESNNNNERNNNAQMHDDHNAAHEWHGMAWHIYMKRYRGHGPAILPRNKQHKKQNPYMTLVKLYMLIYSQSIDYKLYCGIAPPCAHTASFFLSSVFLSSKQLNITEWAMFLFCASIEADLQINDHIEPVVPSTADSKQTSISFAATKTNTKHTGKKLYHKKNTKKKKKLSEGSRIKKGRRNTSFEQFIEFEMQRTRKRRTSSQCYINAVCVLCSVREVLPLPQCHSIGDRSRRLPHR